jgi:non-ribosomal peptide synthetase component F
MATDTQPAYPFIPFDNTAINQSIPARFEQQVARYPDRLAVASADRTCVRGVWTLSLGDLDARRLKTLTEL